MTSFLLAALFFAAELAAAEPATIWTGKDVTAKLAATKPDANKITQDSLGKFGNYSMSVTKREASGIGEQHQNTVDVFVVQSGECTLVTGGKLTAPKNQSATEIRGSGVEGGTKQVLKAGDVVRIPAKTPHQMLLEPGKNIVYAVVKVESAKE
jgi:mannose-6-phosphate isomerase-like protein (cupin superfamily)